MTEHEDFEADRIYAFCLSGRGHRNVIVEGPDESVGIFGTVAYCDDCGTDLSNDDLLNPRGI
jgi:hypothetical protein